MIENGSTVKFHYTLQVDEEVVDSSREREPMTYVHGSGQLIPGLERVLEGREQGERMGVDVPPEQAYGQWNPEAVRVVPISEFENPQNLKEGARVRGKANGKEFEASITEVGDERITLDLNHPLAGKTLKFDVEILDVS